VIVPFIVDQPWWAHKLYKQNLGPKSLPLRKLKSKNVYKRISQALTYKQNVIDVSQKMSEDKGIEETLRILKEYLDNKY
jgi:sterol 3beta-glucosyltransferase